MLFVGMFLVVQSVYEDKVRQVERVYESQLLKNNYRMTAEPPETSMNIKDAEKKIRSMKETPMDVKIAEKNLHVMKNDMKTYGEIVGEQFTYL